MECKKCRASWNFEKKLSVCPFCGASLEDDTPPKSFDSVGDVLCYIVKTYGDNVYDNGSIVISYMSDLAPQFRDERRLIKCCLDAAVPSSLLSAKTRTPAEFDIAVSTLLTRMCEKFYLSEAAAKEGLGWIAGSFGITLSFSSYEVPAARQATGSSADPAAAASVTPVPAVSAPAPAPSADDGSDAAVDSSQMYASLSSQITQLVQSSSAQADDDDDDDDAEAPIDLSALTSQLSQLVQASSSQADDDDDDDEAEAPIDLSALTSQLSQLVQTSSAQADDDDDDDDDEPEATADSADMLSQLGQLLGSSFSSSASAAGTDAYDPNDFVIKRGILKKYKGNKSVVTVPSEVSVIGFGAFQDCTTLTEVILPKGIKKIKMAAFDGCKSLSKINIPDSAEVNITAFDGCDLLIKKWKADNRCTYCGSVFKGSKCARCGMYKK